MKHLEKLQKLLDQYKSGLLTPEAYERYVQQEMAIEEVNRLAVKYWR